MPSYSYHFLSSYLSFLPVVTSGCWLHDSCDAKKFFHFTHFNTAENTFNQKGCFFFYNCRVSMKHVYFRNSNLCDSLSPCSLLVSKLALHMTVQACASLVSVNVFLIRIKIHFSQQQKYILTWRTFLTTPRVCALPEEQNLHFLTPFSWDVRLMQVKKINKLIFLMRIHLDGESLVHSSLLKLQMLSY